MSIAGMSATGYDMVGDIVATHMDQYHLHTDGVALVMDMLSKHTTVAPVVDDDGRLAGFIGEVEILEALRNGKDIHHLQAEDLMKEPRIVAVTEMTSLSKVLQLFKEKHLHIIPVTREGRVIKSITRHDLIRALIGAGLGVEK